MFFVPMLLSLQTASSAPEEIVAPLEVRSQLDRLFTQPVFAPFAKSYQNRVAAGLKVVKRGWAYYLKIEDETLPEWGYSIWFDAKSQNLSSFSIEHTVTKPESLPLPILEAFLRGAVLQVDPGVPRSDLRFRDRGVDREVLARRVSGGRPIGDELRIGVGATTGRLTLVDPTDYVIDPLPYGNAKILPAESLRDAGYAQYAGQAFPQAELVTDEVVIDRPNWIGRERPPRYATLGLHGIPTYVMRWESPGGSYVEVQMDARDGTVFHAYRAEAMGSSEKAPVPVPTKVGVGRQRGSLVRTEKRSDTPAGSPVTFRGGATDFGGLYDAKSAELWYRPDARQPYRAFRPDVRLRSALAAQVKRTEVMGKARVK